MIDQDEAACRPAATGSLRAMMARGGYPGPGPGRVALVVGEAGVGKSALLAGIGLDAALREENVLHITLDRPVSKIEAWYDTLLSEMLPAGLGSDAAIAFARKVECRRHIHAFLGESFTAERIGRALALLTGPMDFVPDFLVVDDFDPTRHDPELIDFLQEQVRRFGGEVWITSLCKEHEPFSVEGSVGPPAGRIAGKADLVFHLDPEERGVRIRVVRDADKPSNEDLHVVLDARTSLPTED